MLLEILNIILVTEIVTTPDWDEEDPGYDTQGKVLTQSDNWTIKLKDKNNYKQEVFFQEKC